MILFCFNHRNKNREAKKMDLIADVNQYGYILDMIEF